MSMVPREFVFVVEVPGGPGNKRQARVKMKIDLEGLARDLGWKAYHSKSWKSTLKNGAIVVKILGIIDPIPLGKARTVEETKEKM